MAVALMRENSAKANTSIYQAAKSQPQYAGMGTTLVVALFYDNRMTVGAHRRFAPVPPARRGIQRR